MRKNEVDLLEALDMLDVAEEVLGRLCEEGKIKTRRAADGTLYFLREDIELSAATKRIAITTAKLMLTGVGQGATSVDQTEVAIHCQRSVSAEELAGLGLTPQAPAPQPRRVLRRPCRHRG